MTEENYYIKKGYTARETAETVEEEFGDYWTEVRMSAADKYQRYVYQLALQLAQKHEFRRIVDIGCGFPAKLAMFEGYNITAIDQKTTVSALAGRFPNYSWIAADLAEPFEDTGEKYDFVICSDVIEHLLDPDPLVDRIRKLTGKLAVISTPERDYLRGFDNMHSPKAEHVREWNRMEFKSYLEASGLKVLQQKLYPQSPVPRLKFVASQVFHFRTKLLSSCQVAICRVN